MLQLDGTYARKRQEAREQAAIEEAARLKCENLKENLKPGMSSDEMRDTCGKADRIDYVDGNPNAGIINDGTTINNLGTGIFNLTGTGNFYRPGGGASTICLSMTAMGVSA